MNRFLFLCVLAFLSTFLHAQVDLSKEAQISILTSSPSDDAVFTVYGHTAIRVSDPINGQDWVFNYGMFDFSTDNFIYRFVKGETDYRLAVESFKGYVPQYEFRGRSVTEQVLNLTQSEKQNVWNALFENAQPENSVYRYNFFFDNCSTRPAAMVDDNLDGFIRYEESVEELSFRDMINFCTRNRPWQTFGCDLVLGSPTDRMTTPQEQLFLPDYLMEAFSSAKIVDKEGNIRPLVKQTSVLTGDIPEEEIEHTFFTPLFCTWFLFLLIAGLTWYEWKKKNYFRIIDVVLFVVAGLAGCILFFLAFISEHPCIWPNVNLVWLHPLHLIGAVLFAVKKWGKAAYYYHFINFAALTLLLLGWYFIPQHLNTAFIPLVGVLWMRSGAGVYRYKSQIG